MNIRALLVLFIFFSVALAAAYSLQPLQMFSVPDRVIRKYATSTTPLTRAPAPVSATSSAPVAEATSTPPTPTTRKPNTVVPKQTPSAQQVATATPVTKQTITVSPDFDTYNTTDRPAVVNIICTTKSGGDVAPITGSGIIIDPKGVILTNAHLGQYWLLQNLIMPNFVQCTIRTGSPAYPQYHAELLYISPEWVADNKTLLTETNPQGTGQYDFALLRITDRVNGSPLPATFPYITPDTREIINLKEPALLISYPAGFLGSTAILQDLSVTSAITTIQDFFTFKENTIDLISVGGTVISQKGASGGGVMDAYNKLIGLISTSSNGNQTSQRDLRAITLGHISRTLLSETGMNLSQFLNQDLASAAHSFQQNTAPGLTKLIADELLK